MIDLKKELSNGVNELYVAGKISTDASRLINEVLIDDDFYRWSGSSKPTQHHYGTGGLARHTLEVLALAIGNAEALMECSPELYDEKRMVDLSVLATATIYHDVGKLFDYEEVDGFWRGTAHKRTIHHISRSALTFQHNCTKLCIYDSAFIDNVLHCILSHHGTREWGSPVMPLTPEAWLLHLCDNISARTYEAFKGLDILKK